MVAALEAEGFRIPDPQRESLRLATFLEEAKTRISLLSLEPYKKECYIDAPKLQIEKLALTHLSPTGLENYDSCSMRFYLERVLRLRETEPQNDPELKAHRFGTWIHETLEEFLQSQSSEKAVLQKILESQALKLFQDIGTEEFREIQSRNSRNLAEKLYAHFKNFEMPLQNVFPIQTRHLETELHSTLASWALKGKVDRIDEASDAMLLFDYKTGNYSAKAKTLVGNSKFQWFIYREHLEKQFHKKILGGGYINPLDPKRSRIFLFENLIFQHPKLIDLFERSAHPFEMLSLKEQSDLDDQLQEKLHSICEGLKNASFAPTPKKASHCSHCSQRVLCGRPYFALEGEPA